METTTPAMENETVNMAALPGKKALAMLRRVMRVIQKGKDKPLPVRFEFAGNTLALTAERELKAASRMQVSVRAAVETAGQTAFVACMRSFAKTLAEETPSELFVAHTEGSEARFVLDTKTVHGPPSIICPAPLAETDPDDVRARFRLDAKTVKDIITRMAPLTAADPIRPALNGIFMCVEPDEITFVATNGNTLQRRVEATEAQVVGPAEVIIPAEALAILKAYMVRSESSVQVTISDQRTVWAFRNADFETTVAISNIEEKYPNYKAVIPEYYPEDSIGFTFAASDMLEVAKVHKRDSRATQGNQYLTIRITHDGAKAYTEMPDPQEVQAALPVCVEMPSAQVLESMFGYNGEYYQVGFNVDYMARVMGKTLAGGSVTMRMASCHRAALIETENATTLLMPVMV